MTVVEDQPRRMGVRQAAFVGVGAMVGAGIFALLGAAGEVAGAAVWLSFLLAGLVAMLQGYSFAKFGARYPSAGGLLEYVARGFGNGHFTGIIAWLVLTTNTIVTGMVAVSFGSYASTAVADGGEAWAKVFAVAVVVGMTALNAVGSHAVARAQTVVVAVVITMLTVFAVATLSNLEPHLLAFSGYPSFRDIVGSVALTFFAFLGFGVITFTAKDLAEPSRQLPRAMFLALGIATVVYLAVALGVFGTLTVDEVIASGGTALAVAAEPVLGRAGYWMMIVTALFSTAGATNAGLYPATGLSEQMVSAGQFPPAMRHKLWDRAGGGLVFTAVLAIVLAVGFDLNAIASIGSVIALLVFGLISVGHLRVRRGDRRQRRAPHRGGRIGSRGTRRVRLHGTGRRAGDGGGAGRDPCAQRHRRHHVEADSTADRLGRRRVGAVSPADGSVVPAPGAARHAGSMIEDPGSARGLRMRDVVAAALRTYRERFWRVAGTAFVVFGLIAAIDAVATVLIIDRHLSSHLGSAVASAASAVFSMVGVVVYAGILDKVVGAHLHGHPDLSLGEIWRVLPLGRLVGADVVLAFATFAGLALFVLPGVICFTLWSLVGPVITIEDRAVWSGFGRSWRLVRPHFWITLCLVTGPLQIEQAALHALHYTEIFEHPFVPAFLLNGLLGMVIGSMVGLVEVVLAYDLIARAETPSPTAAHVP